MSPDDLVRQGKLTEALAELQGRVRADAADANARVGLFHVLSVLGQWDRAITHLNVAVDLDPECAMLGQVYSVLLNCEAHRNQVFAGKTSPLIFGEPEEWVMWMTRAAALNGAGEHTQASELRAKALEAAPAVPGTIDGLPFAWLAENDSRLGPILEAVINGKYFWVPMHRIAELSLDRPKLLRDRVWLRGDFTWANGGQAVGYIPVRYVNTEKSSHPDLLMAVTTEFQSLNETTQIGIGGRVLATDQGEYALLEVGKIVFANATGEAGHV